MFGYVRPEGQPGGGVALGDAIIANKVIEMRLLRYFSQKDKNASRLFECMGDGLND